MRFVPEKLKVGTKVMAARDLASVGVKQGMVGVCFELANAYGDGNGPMVRWENGTCGNVYVGDVLLLQ